MSPARILNGISRVFLTVSAAAVLALAGTAAGTVTAAGPGGSGRAAGGVSAPGTAGAPGRPLPGSLPASLTGSLPGGLLAGPARAARYTLTAHQSRRAHRTPRQIARHLLARYHWAHWQFRYLDLLWDTESSWNPQAANPGSGAYGIPQAVPGSKMAAAGADWRWDARTQIRWGMRYIRARYGSPATAWQHECWYGWY